MSIPMYLWLRSTANFESSIILNYLSILPLQLVVIKMKKNCEDSKIWSRYLLSTLLLIIVLIFTIKVEFAYAEDLKNIYE